MHNIVLEVNDLSLSSTHTCSPEPAMLMQSRTGSFLMKLNAPDPRLRTKSNDKERNVYIEDRAMSAEPAVHLFHLAN